MNYLILIDPMMEIETAVQVMIESYHYTLTLPHMPMLSFLSHISRYPPSFGRETGIFPSLQESMACKLQCSLIEVTFNYHLQSYLTYVVNYVK